MFSFMIKHYHCLQTNKWSQTKTEKWEKKKKEREGGGREETKEGVRKGSRKGNIEKNNSLSSWDSFLDKGRYFSSFFARFLTNSTIPQIHC